MAWIYLLAAGLFEIGWPLGMKYAQTTSYRITGIAASVLALAASGFFMWLAQRDIPMGTSYAIWCGIGTAGTFLTGIWLFGDAGSLMRYAGVSLILVGVVVLKLAA